MEIECPYCGTAHLLDLGGHKPAILTMLHCLMCGGRLSLPEQPQPAPGYTTGRSASAYHDHYHLDGGVEPVTLEAIRPKDRDQYAPFGSVYDERLGTWVPYTTGTMKPWVDEHGNILHEPPPWHGINQILQESKTEIGERITPTLRDIIRRSVGLSTDNDD